MSDELMITPDNLPSLIPTDEETEAASTKSSFVPSLKLIQGSSGECGKEDSQGVKIALGDYYIPIDDLSIGDLVEIVVVGRRAHALLIRDKKKILETYDHTSETWDEIKRTTDNYSEGVVKFVGEGDWLIFLPQYSRFITFFCGKPATYPFTTQVKKYMQKPEERKQKVDRNLPWTNHFMLSSQVKNWGTKFKAMSPMLEPKELFTLRDSVSAEDAQQASDAFYAPVKALPQPEDER